MTRQHEHEYAERRSPTSVRVMTVIEVQHLRGSGCCAESPARIVASYFRADGTMLAEQDPVEPRPKPA